MLRIFWLALLLLKFSVVSFTQNNPGIVVENLFYYNQPIAGISLEEYKYFLPYSYGKENIENFRQCLIRNNKGLYVALVGSGRLYKADLKNGTIQFERIDSTVYFGSNFRSYNFSYRDTIYSLGGYGFWKTNGLLRYFVEKRNEWEIIKLNREIPLITEKEYDLIWFDQNDGKLYFGFTREENSTTTNEKDQIGFHYETKAIDLNKKEWQTLGSLNPFLKNNLNGIYNMTSSPWGQMIAFNKKILFLDYHENKIYQLNPDKQKIIEHLPTSTGDPHCYYFKDSVYFSGISSRNLLDSVIFSKNDLILLKEKIYTPGKIPNTTISKSGNGLANTLLIAAVCLFILILADYFIRKVILNKKYSSTIELKSSNAITHNIFTEMETAVLKAIAANSGKGKLTSIEELNNLLGVTKKSFEIQKKQRSDIISSINKKYSYLKNGNGELIERKQAEFDKRSFEYFIEYAKLSEITSLKV